MNQDSHSERKATDVPAKKRARTERATSVGVTRFKDLVAGSSPFIDKSLFIKDFLRSPHCVLLITCPRRWGKTINMDMIKTFLEIEVDEKGQKRESKCSTSNYKLFVEGEGTRLQKPLLISQEEYIISKYLGEYPVIYVNFKDVKGASFNDILDGVRTAISKSFEQHKYLIRALENIIKDPNVSEFGQYKAKISLDRIGMFYPKSTQSVDKVDIQGSLEFLSEILHDYFKKRVCVLMDEYDAPLHNILRNGQFSSEDLYKTRWLIEFLMSITFKGNENLERGLITGTSKISKASAGACFNNAREYNFNDNEFAKHYGFNQDEVESLFKEYNVSPELSERAREWYNGYRFSVDSKLRIYNPWSIVNFLENRKIRNYWAETEDIDFIDKLFKVDGIIATIQALINAEDEVIDLDNFIFSREDFLALQKLASGDMDSSVRMRYDLILSYMCATGYLTLDNSCGTSSYCSSVRLPNGEVTSELSYKLKNYYIELYDIPLDLFKNAKDALEDLFSVENTTKFKEALQSICSKIKFTEIAEAGHSGVHPNEKLFRSIVNIIAIEAGYSKCGSEVPRDTGEERRRADVALIDSDRKVGIIVEIKYNSSDTTALAQAKKHAPIFEGHDYVHHIQYLGVNVTSDNIVTIATDLEDRQKL